MMTARSVRVNASTDGEEIARYWSKVVKGPLPTDCWLWTGAIADDGYGRFWITRGNRAIVVRPHRWALALVHGVDLATVEVGEHVVCDVPICVRVAGDDLDHVFISTQADNLARMGSRMRGGGAWWQHRWRGGDRAAVAAKARALRNAVSEGWDAEAVRAALDGVSPEQPTLF